MKDIRIAFISSGNPHPTSMESAKSINADVYRIDKKQGDSIIKSLFQSIKLGFQIRKRYDYFLVESTLSIIPILIRKCLFFNRCKIVHRANAGEYNSIIKKEGRLLERICVVYLLNKTDYVIAISKLIKQQVERVFPGKQISISETFVCDNKYFDIKPDLKSNNFIFVGNYFENNDHKGIEDLIKKFNRLYDNQIINSKLYILGRDTEKLSHLVKHPNKIIIKGYDDPQKYFNKCTFYIHNAKFEAGGAIVLEAMAAGLIPIVSVGTGNLDFLNMSNTLFINQYHDNDRFQVIVSINYNRTIQDKKDLSKRARKIVQEHATLEIGRTKFRRAFMKNV